MPTPEQEQEMLEMEAEVDVTLIDWMLSLTPIERLKVIQEFAETTWRIRNAPRNVQLLANPHRSAEA